MYLCTTDGRLPIWRTVPPSIRREVLFMSSASFFPFSLQQNIELCHPSTNPSLPLLSFTFYRAQNYAHREFHGVRHRTGDTKLRDMHQISDCKLTSALTRFSPGDGSVWLQTRKTSIPPRTCSTARDICSPRRKDAVSGSRIHVGLISRMLRPHRTDKPTVK